MIATDLGRFQLGQFVPLMFSAVNNTDVASWPDACPTIKTYDASDVTTVVETIRPAAHDLLRVTGMFRYPLRLSSSYAASKVYLVVATYAISATNYGTMMQFTTMPGGDSDGAVIGATFVRRPEAGVVAYVKDGGKLLAANNPR